MSDNKLTWISHERYYDEAEYNLICFPYAGGSAAYFASLKSCIDKKINLCPVLYPGREKNAKLNIKYETIEEMAMAFVSENEHLFEKKFALLGHCTGSLVAYETELAIEKLYHRHAEIFFASSAPAPSCEQFFPKQGFSDNEMTEYLLSNKMIDKSFVENPVYSSYFLPLMKTDLKMHLKYEPCKPYIKMNTSVNVLYGTEDMLFKNDNAINEWEYFTKNGVESSKFCGGHFYIDLCRDEVGGFISGNLLMK